MRVRNVLATFGAAVLLTGVLAAPASAGTGSSTQCTDTGGYQEISVMRTPMTVAIQLRHAPGGSTQYILVCYSTTPEGQPGTITGGAFAVHTVTDTGTVSPGAYVGIGCYPDYVTGVGPNCAFANSANVAAQDVRVAPGTVCLVSVGLGCVAGATIPYLVTNGDPGRPLLAIQALSVPVVLDSPYRCIAVAQAC